jgi:FkbM family methyltransferase
MIKQVTKKLMKRFGLEIQRTNVSMLRPAVLRRLFAHHGVDLVFDVGASFGQYARSLRENGFTGRIVSFEPQSVPHAKMKESAKDDPKWDVFPPVAVGSSEGETTINISSNSYSSSVLDMLDQHVKLAPHSAYVASEKVRLARLDDIGKPYLTPDIKAAFLKMDVQGFEREVLAGAEGILPRIAGVQCELTLSPLYKDQVLYREMLDILEGHGFALHSVFPGFTDINTGRMMQMDGVFFRSKP